MTQKYCKRCGKKVWGKKDLCPRCLGDLLYQGKRRGSSIARALPCKQEDAGWTPALGSSVVGVAQERG